METVDYHLNHIYCPFFEISYRKKHKLFLQPEKVEIFLSGDEGAAKKIAKEFVSQKHKENKKSLSKDSKRYEQLSLVSEDEDD